MAKKRANGEGNIRKRKDDRWEGRYTAGYDAKTGRRIIRNVLGRTQAEVKEKLKRALEETNGLDVSKTADEYTVASWLRTWYELYAKPNIRTAIANRKEPGQGPEHHHCAQRPSDAPLCPGQGCEGAADPAKPQRGLYCAQAPETGHKDPAAGAHPRLPGGRPSARAPR